MELLLMKHTLAYIFAKANAGDETAKEQMEYYNTLVPVDKGNYIVLNNKEVTDETS